MPLDSAIVSYTRVLSTASWHENTSVSVSDVSILRFTTQNPGNLN